MLLPGAHPAPHTGWFRFLGKELQSGGGFQVLELGEGEEAWHRLSKEPTLANEAFLWGQSPFIFKACFISSSCV